MLAFTCLYERCGRGLFPQWKDRRPSLTRGTDEVEAATETQIRFDCRGRADRIRAASGLHRRRPSSFEAEPRWSRIDAMRRSPAPL